MIELLKILLTSVFSLIGGTLLTILTFLFVGGTLIVALVMTMLTILFGGLALTVVATFCPRHILDILETF